MSDHDAHLEDFVEIAPIDGVHELRQRQTSRLWYRSVTTAPRPTPIRRPARVSLVDEPEFNAPKPEPVEDSLAEIAKLAIAAGRRVEAQPEPSSTPAPALEPEMTGQRDVEAADWQIVPNECPTLMLSASPTLGGRISEAQLSPGTRYRVSSVANGVAQVDVSAGGGRVIQGYCNTVDLACAGSTFSGSRLGSTRGLLPKTGKIKIQSFTQAFGSMR
jgi:hypothetical protein